MMIRFWFKLGSYSIKSCLKTERRRKSYDLRLLFGGVTQVSALGEDSFALPLTSKLDELELGMIRERVKSGMVNRRAHRQTGAYKRGYTVDILPALSFLR
jgi:hypothetical protein